MKKCLILNGPPGCGKDTIAKILIEKCGFTKFENKAPMFNVALAMTGMTHEEWFGRYNNRDLKEVPWDRLNGMSQRDFMIWISEEVMKPRLGDDIFGRLAAQAAILCEGDVVFSDGGFQPEMACLQDAFGKSNVLLVHLHREGFSFDGDSRNYLKPAGSHLLSLYLNTGRPDIAADAIRAKLHDITVKECDF